MHPDARLAQPQFPPPGYQAQPVAPHQAPDHYPGLLGTGEQPPSEPPVGEGEVVEYTDYFGFSETHRYVMPDGKQWIEFKTLNEGDLAKYQALLNRDVTVEKSTGNARIKINQVEERHALLQVAITGWHMMRPNNAGKWQSVPFSKDSSGSTLSQWIRAANPQIIADLDEVIRKLNPTLLAANNETVEAIEKQIADLEDQKRAILERMRGNESSATN